MNKATGGLWIAGGSVLMATFIAGNWGGLGSFLVPCSVRLCSADLYKTSLNPTVLWPKCWCSFGKHGVTTSPCKVLLILKMCLDTCWPGLWHPPPACHLNINSWRDVWENVFINPLQESPNFTCIRRKLVVLLPYLFMTLLETAGSFQVCPNNKGS